jgi:probable rRNA maturation factor
VFRHWAGGRNSALLFAFCAVPPFTASNGEQHPERDLVILHLVILEKRVAGLSESALGRFVLRARKAVGLRTQVNVLVTSSAAVRSLNRQFRRQNKATDVLSFPSNSLGSQSRGGAKAKTAGDVAISADIALDNSIKLGHPVSQEIKILVLHGILHLAGFDHERDNGEMARKELRLRRALRLPAALIERVQVERAQPDGFHPAAGSSVKPRQSQQRAARARSTA